MKALKLLILATGMLMLVACDYGNESNVDDYSVDSDVEFESEADQASDYKAEEAQGTYRNKGSGETLKIGLARFVDNDVDGANKPAMRTNDKIIKKGSVGVKVKDYEKQQHFF